MRQKKGNIRKNRRNFAIFLCLILLWSIKIYGDEKAEVSDNPFIYLEMKETEEYDEQEIPTVEVKETEAEAEIQELTEIQEDESETFSEEEKETDLETE